MTGNDVTHMLDGFIGQQIPGGCEHCDAYQTIERWPDIPAGDGAGAFQLHVFHDDGCPTLQRHQNRAARRQALKRARRKR